MNGPLTRFSPGDIAIIVGVTRPDWQEYNGMECEILSPLRPIPPKQEAGYIIEPAKRLAGHAELPKESIYCAWQMLKPLEDPGLPGVWSECVWRPNPYFIRTTRYEPVDKQRLADRIRDWMARHQ